MRAAMSDKRHAALTAVVLVVCATLLSACDIRRNMYDQAKFEPYEATDFFGDRQSSRPLDPNTVPREHEYADDHLYRGSVDGIFVDTFPFPVTAEVLERGKSRFNIYCTPCHGAAGYGDGMIVQRGYKQPTDYHSVGLRDNPDKPVGYFYDVISNGFGVMAGYGYQLKPHDRWAVVAYVRALQFSQHAIVGDLPEEDQAALAALREE